MAASQIATALLLAAATLAPALLLAEPPCRAAADCAATTLFHLPGPNPVITPWNPSTSDHQMWMATECEVAGGVVEFEPGQLVFTYHCLNANNSVPGVEHPRKYQVGMSVADSPLGPWTKPPTTPTLGVGETGEWDSFTVASLNILPDPEDPGQWLGYYEGNYDFQSLGLVRAAHPLGPWRRDARSPIMSESASQDLSRSASGGLSRCFPNPSAPHDPLACDSYYVASVLHGNFTNHSFFMYAEAPIGPSDEGPLALWVAEEAAGPFQFKAYILDGALEPTAPDGTRRWDAGRYSESGVRYADGLFHVFPSASPQGLPQPDKEVENIGWAWSSNGINFTQHVNNPVAAANESTPLTSAMAESHVHFGELGLTYAYHTIRWTTQAPSAFAPQGRNAEDLGVEVLISNTSFGLTMPLITHLWAATFSGLSAGLLPNETTPCEYGRRSYRYCVQLKTELRARGAGVALRPIIRFRVRATCGGAGTKFSSAAATVVVSAFDTTADAIGQVQAEMPLVDAGCVDGWLEGVTAPLVKAVAGPVPTFVVASLKNTGQLRLGTVTMDAIYEGDGKIYSV